MIAPFPQTGPYPPYGPPVPHPRPLKQVYPWWTKAKEKRMTIAAGFVHEGGVLLCADTEMTAGEQKFHQSKLAMCECSFGRLAVAFAGNLHVAASIIQKIQDKAKNADGAKITDVIEGILDKQYRRLVLSRDVNERWQYDAWFIFAVQLKDGSRVAMYATDGLSFWRGNTYECLGIGSALARPIIESGYWGSSDRAKMLLLAARVMSATKNCVSGCGGMSLYLDLGNDGSASQFYGDKFLEQLEEYSGILDMHVWQLARAMSDVNMTDGDFEGNLEIFNEQIRRGRQKWAQLKERHAMTSDAFKLISRPKQ